MQPAEIIAQVFGPLYLIAAAGMIVNADSFQKMIEEYLESPALCYLGGVLALVGGMVILVFHRTWTADWTVVITVIGWLAVLKGASLLVYPAVVIRFSAALFKNTNLMRVWAIGPLALGLFLTVMGFGLV